MKREDDFSLRRTHLQGMSDEALKDYFWSLAQQVVNPLLELGTTYTSPAIERSVLLRMGFSSLEAKPMVELSIVHNLIAHGVGNVVYRLAKTTGMPLRETGLAMSRGELWEKAEALFAGGGHNG